MSTIEVMSAMLSVSLYSATAFAFLIIAFACGTHAYWRHCVEAKRAFSSRLWHFHFFSALFLFLAVANSMIFYVSINLRLTGKVPLYFGFSTVLVVLTYLVVLAGAKHAADHKK